MLKIKRRSPAPEPEPEYRLNTLPGKVYRAFDVIDNMPDDLRRCVHEIGWEPVSVMMAYNLPPKAMIAIAVACWTAPRSAHQIHGWDTPPEMRSSPVLQHLDTLLHRAGAQISAMMLLRMLYRLGMVIVPFKPSTPMISASMETVAGHDIRVTKEQKHRLRLEAAIAAGAKRLWPHLFTKNDDRAA